MSDLFEIDEVKKDGLLKLMSNIHAHLCTGDLFLILDTASLVGLIYGHAFLVVRNRDRIELSNPLFWAAAVAHTVISRCMGERGKEPKGYFGICFPYQRALLLFFVKLFLMEVDNGTIEVPEEFSFEVGQLRVIYNNEITNILDLLCKVSQQDPNRAVYFSTERGSVVMEVYPQEQLREEFLENFSLPKGGLLN